MPIKGGGTAKSRLMPSLIAAGFSSAAAESLTRRLAPALGADCLRAVAACADVTRIVVVTSAADVQIPGSPKIEICIQHGEGLANAVQAGITTVTEGPVAVLLGDLPALTPTDLSCALRAAAALLCRGADQIVVPDQDSIGTVLLAARTPAQLTPTFGGASAAAHAGLGAVRCELDLPGLRRDVDTLDDLIAVSLIGCGPDTRAILADMAPLAR